MAETKKWVPGPWIKRYDDRVTTPDDTDGTKSIAHIYDTRKYPGTRDLIAAAPALYEALSDWLGFAEETLSEFDTEECMAEDEQSLCPKCRPAGCIKMKFDAARAALALAEGKQ